MNSQLDVVDTISNLTISAKHSIAQWTSSVFRISSHEARIPRLGIKLRRVVIGLMKEDEGIFQRVRLSSVELINQKKWQKPEKYKELSGSSSQDLRGFQFGVYLQVYNNWSVFIPQLSKEQPRGRLIFEVFEALTTT